jgi:hypothetical protein
MTFFFQAAICLFKSCLIAWKDQKNAGSKHVATKEGLIIYPPAADSDMGRENYSKILTLGTPPVM